MNTDNSQSNTTCYLVKDADELGYVAIAVTSEKIESVLGIAFTDDGLDRFFAWAGTNWSSLTQAADDIMKRARNMPSDMRHQFLSAGWATLQKRVH